VGATLKFNINAFNDLEAGTRHELIEHLIRFIAFIQARFGSTAVGWNPILKPLLLGSWRFIRSISYRVGYAAGVANAEKFSSRVVKHAPNEKERESIYRLLSSPTGLELSIRNNADASVASKQYDRAKELYNSLISSAKESGNRLNEMKGILGIAHVNVLLNIYPSLSIEQLNRFDELSREIEGYYWSNHFKRLKIKFSL
jgi:hypothetical protein